MENKAFIFDITPFMTEDGPGIRTGVFFKGCPLKCKWCSNVYGLNSKAELLFNNNKCILCYNCISVCKENAISINMDKTIRTDLTKCTCCGSCAESCYSKARKIVGKYYTVSEIFDSIKKDRAFFRRNSGGITVSGGEILLQWETVTELLEKCDFEGIHTAIETSAFGEWENLQSILKYTQVAFIDLKCMNSELHKKLTGVENKIILENIKRAAQYCFNQEKILVIRMPLIPKLNDFKENILTTANFVAGLPGNIELNILPYHNYGADKYEYVGKEYELKDLVLYDKEALAGIDEILCSTKVNYSIGGYNVISYT